MKRDYYGEIDKALKRYEEHKYPIHRIPWITDRITWCWNYRHITKEQLEELCQRAIDIMERMI